MTLDTIPQRTPKQSANWQTSPCKVKTTDARGVILYAPMLDAVICVPCQRMAGPHGPSELGSGLRPATSIDMERLGCCSSCGRDFSEVL